MQVTDEMVERAQLAADSQNVMVPAKAMRAALSAALSALVEEKPVGVKALEWHREPPYHVARVFGNLYAVEAWDGGVTLSGVGGRRDFKTVADAKAAAYADYKERVLALVEVMAVESQPVALIEREVLAELQKHWNATGTVCSPLFEQSRYKIFDKVPLYASPVRSALAPAPAGEDVALQQNLRDTFEALCAMRDSINEHIPMPSLESDLLRGPETTVFCSVVAEAVISAIQDCSALSRKPYDAQTVGDGSTSRSKGKPS